MLRMDSAGGPGKGRGPAAGWSAVRFHGCDRRRRIKYRAMRWQSPFRTIRGNSC